MKLHELDCVTHR